MDEERTDDINPEVQPEADYGAGFEPDDELSETDALKLKLKKIKEELERVKKERQEYLDGWQRCKADAINARKDVESRATRTAELLRQELAHDIIPALDSFDMAAESEAWDTIEKGWRSGMERVRAQLIEALKKHGIERYGKVGDMFDPALHEVVQETDDVPGKVGEIIRVLRAGYRSDEHVLRAAQVITKK